MDTSETYIQMCDCEEIQGKHDLETHDSLEDGDFFAQEVLKDRPKGVFVFKELCPYCEPSPGIKITWLPRQDQIQEMWDDWPTIIIMHHGGEYLIEMKPEGEVIDEKGFREMFGKYYARSLEQAWLMLYMHQKHKKTWDKDKWVDLEGK